MATGDVCPSCGVAATRPDIIWSGESPYRMNDIYSRLRRAKMFVQIGSSGTVHPSAGFVDIARALGAATLALNLEPPGNASRFDDLRLGKASEIVPARVEEALARR